MAARVNISSLLYKNMNNGRKISLKYLPALLLAALIFFQTHNSNANYSTSLHFSYPLTPWADTTKPLLHDTTIKDSVIKDTSVKDTTRSMLLPSDSLQLDSAARDSVHRQVDTLQMSKDSIDAPITYTASDSVVLEVPTKKVILYNQSNTKYKDLDLKAYKIEYDQEKQVVVATYTRDTANNIVGKPVMIQADSKMESDTIVYNMKTKKGITRNTFTNSGEMFIHGERMKKINESEFYALRGRFTTCNYDTPHFAFIANKMKLINKKLAVTGPIHPEFEGVPIPIYIPFGFFPLSQGRHSGLLPGTFTSSPQFGLGLEGLGYYKVINDNYDVILRTNLYTYGGWNVYVTPEYRVRYRYSGTMNFVLQHVSVLSNTGKQEFDKSNNYSLTWSHVMDSKARPGVSFSANVNVASTQYNRYVYNNPTINYTNKLSSSIAYSKTWNGKYNLTVSANHSQDNTSRQIDINLPTVGFTATTIYPFQPKIITGEQKWYEKFGIGLTTNILSKASFYDSTFSFKKVLDTAKWGAHHSIPIALALPMKGAIQISPGISLQQNWYSTKLFQHWDAANNKVDSVIQKGFYVRNDVGFSLSLSTAIFGTFTKFGKNSKILGIHHVIRPTVSLNYKPDLAGADYYDLQINQQNINRQHVSVFTGNVFSPFSPGTFGGINFGLDNSFEMKTRSKNDTSETGIKKLKLIDGIGFTGGYNYLADSFKLSQISLYFRSNLFQNVNITGGATLDPYITDSVGTRRNILAWEAPGKKFSLGKITSGNLALSTSFKSKPKDQKAEDERKKAESSQLPMTMEEQQAQMNYIRQNAAEFADFNIQWSVNVSFAFTFSRILQPNYQYITQTYSSLTLNGDFNLTQNWKVGSNIYYDVKKAAINSLSMFISRNLHCWQLSINVIPVGYNRSFNITISPKSGILRDLKINRTRYFYGS
jgi:LPS-assembly protein